MTAWLRLSIFVAALVPALVLAGFWGQSVVRAAALVPDAKGQKLQVKSKMVYGREKVCYDLEKKRNFRSAGWPLLSTASSTRASTSVSGKSTTPPRTGFTTT